jgi:hypothetical protein
LGAPSESCNAIRNLLSIAIPHVADLRLSISTNPPFFSVRVKGVVTPKIRDGILGFWVVRG